MENTKKEEFVGKELLSLLCKVNTSIVNASYSEVGYEEFVTVTFKNDSTKTICVTADSLFAITLDVMRKVC